MTQNLPTAFAYLPRKGRTPARVVETRSDLFAFKFALIRLATEEGFYADVILDVDLGRRVLWVPGTGGAAHPLSAEETREIEPTLTVDTVAKIVHLDNHDSVKVLMWGYYRGIVGRKNIIDFDAMVADGRESLLEKAAER